MRFSLRTLLIVMLLAGPLCAFFRVPADVEVISGGEIEKFIADRAEQKRGL